MNEFTMAGIVVIGIGTFLVKYGSNKNQAKATQQITNRIEKTQRKIDELKADHQLSEKEIQKIESEFLSWADTFLEKKEEMKIELEKTVLREKGNRVKLNSIWRPQIKSFLEEIRNTLEAYNSKSADTIKMDIPDLPKDIFKINADSYNAHIDFRKDIIWNVNISPAKEHAKNPMVRFNIEILKDTLGNYDSATEKLALLLNPERIQIVIFKNTRFNLKTISEVSDYSEGLLRELARSMIENQLLQIK